MSTLPTQFPASDDSRLELAMAAMRSERRNRPRVLVIVALLVLIVSVIYLAWMFTSRAAAATRLSRVSASLGSIQGVVAQLESLEEQRASPRYDPETDMFGKLQRFATQVGLPRVEVQPRDSTTTTGVKGFKKRLYTAVINDADPALLLRWVTESTDGATFPGLEIESLRLTPGRTLESGKVGWTLNIDFRRWERQP